MFCCWVFLGYHSFEGSIDPIYTPETLFLEQLKLNGEHFRVSLYNRQRYRYKT